MRDIDMLGVLAHRGGLLVDRPELRVGVVRAISLPSRLEIELIARQPPDRRTAEQRQADIRAGLRTAPAPRRLLPVYDEGLDLRVGWLDGDGRAHWEYAQEASFSGGPGGSWWQSVLRLPPRFDRLPLVLAWPEIGFPETVVELSLPDRETVERESVPAWSAPVRSVPAPSTAVPQAVPFSELDSAPEEGTVVAGPLVAIRGDEALVLLDRLTVQDRVCSAELVSVAHGEIAEVLVAQAFPPDRESPVPRNGLTGATLAVIRDGGAFWAEARSGRAAGSPGFTSRHEYVFERPEGDTASLLVGWSLAGLGTVRLDIPLPS